MQSAGNDDVDLSPGAGFSQGEVEEEEEHELFDGGEEEDREIRIHGRAAAGRKCISEYIHAFLPQVPIC